VAATKKKGRATNAAQSNNLNFDSAKDSRMQVVKQQRRSEREMAHPYRTSGTRTAQLRQIAATTYSHELRVIKSMTTGEITAEEAVKYLDTAEPHARLNAIRERLPVIDRWVLTPTATGSVRRVKAYRLPPQEAPHE
jgi:hypothetical protein